MSIESRLWRLAAHPKGPVEPSDFSLETVTIEDLDDGQFRVAIEYIAFEPAMRSWIMGRDTYVKGVQVGDVMRALAVGVIEESRHPEVEVGQRVVGNFGWREHAVASSMRDFGGIRAVPEGTPPTWPLSILGITGLTAYFGLLDIGQPKPGDAILVSGAAGATGSVAAQIAKHVKGASRVVGVAGGPEKCAWLTEVAGLDAAIDYKAFTDQRALTREVFEQFPDGIDVFFDNVGGPILDAALARINNHARIVVCGAISRYDTANPGPGPGNYTTLILKPGPMEGFVGLDYASRFGEAARELADCRADGKLTHAEDAQAEFAKAQAV